MKKPWINPRDVIEYTDIAAVASRAESKLKIDIARAEALVVSYTHNDFTDIEYATSIPESVRLALILLAEAYASQSVTNAKITAGNMKSGMKSESFDDYSYTVAESSSEIDVTGMNLASLLDPYVKPVGSGNIVMRMRKI